MICLFIYSFYRTEKTIVNQLTIWLVTTQNYHSVKTTIVSSLPLNDWIIYSLPEALWIFCVTILSKNFFIQWNSWSIKCKYIPLMICTLLELMQLIQLTPGTFDVRDIVFIVLFWIMAILFSTNPRLKENIFKPLNRKSLFCLVSYLIIYLAHVST
jgi:hypothetical protein